MLFLSDDRAVNCCAFRVEYVTWAFDHR
jgi:hypothetical protein